MYSDYNPRFTEVAYRYVRDRGIAEDLVSDSFMAFWEERDRLPEDVNAPAYVLTIVKNKCLNHLKPGCCTCRSRKSCIRPSSG